MREPSLAEGSTPMPADNKLNCQLDGGGLLRTSMQQTTLRAERVCVQDNLAFKASVGARRSWKYPPAAAICPR